MTGSINYRSFVEKNFITDIDFWIPAFDIVDIHGSTSIE